MIRLTSESYELSVPQQIPMDLLVPTQQAAESNLSTTIELEHDEEFPVVTEDDNFWESFSVSWLECCAP